MNLLTLALASIIEYENNPRKNDHAVDDMAALIEAHGFRVPVLVVEYEDGWGLVDGHLRVKAARKLGLETIIALDVSEMPEEQIEAFRVSVNRASEFAEWDVPKLLAELDAIALPKDDLPALTGMDDSFLASLQSEPALVVPDAKPASFAGEPRERAADPNTVRLDTDVVSLNLNMTVAQRREVTTHLDRIKEQHGLETRAAALILAVTPAAKTPDAKPAKARSRTKTPK
jgi:hypothetical protein